MINQNNAILEAVQKLDHATGLGVSGRYKAINTAELVRMFQSNGFAVTAIQGVKTRSPERQAYAKHMIRLRPHGFSAVDGVFPEVILRNSFDGSSAYTLKLGLFRLVCSNGMVTGKTYENFYVRHVGNAVEQVMQSAKLVMRQANRMLETVDGFKSIELPYSVQAEFAMRASVLVVPETALTVDATGLLARRRSLDMSQDLWTVLNVVQENLMYGNSVRYTAINANGKQRNGTVRRIKAIDRNLSVNSQLWDLAEEFYQKLSK